MEEEYAIFLGSSDIGHLFDFLGIESVIVEKPEEFVKNFDVLTKSEHIGMIIIGMDLPANIVDSIIDFKLNNHKPFVFHITNIFEPNIDRKDIIFNRINKLISEIII